MKYGRMCVEPSDMAGIEVEDAGQDDGRRDSKILRGTWSVLVSSERRQLNSDAHSYKKIALAILLLRRRRDRRHDYIAICV